jgi:multicomponent K+:H+ antiporter subunit E
LKGDAMLKPWLPQPLLTVCLALLWLMLANSYTAGSLIMGVIVGVAVPPFTHLFWPNPPRLARPLTIARYAAIVVKDVVLANIEVAKIVLFKRNEDLQPGFIAVPLDLTSPEAITVLAGTITMTPGTLSADLSADGRTLLVHGLHLPDANATLAEIKERYETRLKEMFP